MANHLSQKDAASLVDHQRFQFLELMIIWQGHITAKMLQSQFEISAQLANHVIQKYMALFPTALQFNGASQSYVAGAQFVAQHCNGSLEEFIQFQHNRQHVSVLAPPSRNVEPALLQPILTAIGERKRLSIHYASISNPDYAQRVIQPHHLVFDGNRWHVRAYCENNMGFRDFVLSRFKTAQDSPCEVLGDADFFDIQDEQWHCQLDIEIMPDPRLDETRQKLIAMDYFMQKGPHGFRKVIPVRAALLLYTIQRLRLDMYQQNPQAQQIILTPACQGAIKEYLPN